MSTVHPPSGGTASAPAPPGGSPAEPGAPGRSPDEPAPSGGTAAEPAPPGGSPAEPAPSGAAARPVRPPASRLAPPEGTGGGRAAGPAGSARTAVVWEVLSAVLAEVDPSGDGLDIVDAGGGTGGFAVPLARAGHRVTVVDPSPDSLAALQRRAAEGELVGQVVGVQGDLADLPDLVAADSVDLLLCHSVLEVVDDPAEALGAVARVLRPGGRLSLLVANRAAAVLARALAGHPDEAARVLTDPAGRWGPADGVHRRFDGGQLSELVEGAGLVVEQVHGVRVVADLVPGSVLDSEPGAAAALLSLERALSERLPFRDLATQLHLLAQRR